jgi:hypothetical protein
MLRRGILLYSLALLLASCSRVQEELQEAAPGADEFAQSMLRHLATKDLNSILAVVDPIAKEKIDRRSLESAAEQLPDDILMQAVQYQRKITKSPVSESTDITGTATFRFINDSALLVLTLGFSRKAGSFYVDQLYVSPYRREK